MTPQQIIEKVKSLVADRQNGFQYKSSYFQIDNLLVRVANNLPNESYIESYNEGVERVMLVMVSDEYNHESEATISRFCDNAKFDTEYLIVDEENEFDGYSEMTLKRFLGI